MMTCRPTLVLIPGAWHKPSCYSKIVKLLQDEHGLKWVSVTLPSTLDNPDASFKDDIDVAREAILSEINHGLDVVVVAHSYGGMVGNSAIRGLTQPKSSGVDGDEVGVGIGIGIDIASESGIATTAAKSTFGMVDSSNRQKCYVKALVLIASGFTITGLSFMDPFFGVPPPSWRIDRETGYATLVADPRELFYHDVGRHSQRKNDHTGYNDNITTTNEGEGEEYGDEVSHWINQLTTQSLKSLFEGGEHAYAGWKDVPTWYIGTIEDRGLPVIAQRMQVGMARGQGGIVHHVELRSSHSPFLSMPQEVVEVIVDVVRSVTILPATAATTTAVDGGGSEETSTSNFKKLQETQTTKGSNNTSGSGGGSGGGRHDNEEARQNQNQNQNSKIEYPKVRLNSPRTWFKYGIPFLFGRLLGWGVFGILSFTRRRRRC